MNELKILNKLKSLARGLDDFLKKSGASSIKFHHDVSAVYQSVYALIEANNVDALHAIFGDSIDDPKALALMRCTLGEFVEGFIAAGNDDQELNKIYNDFRILDKEARFPLRIEPTPRKSLFHGHLIVTDAFNVSAPLEKGKLVNIHLTINRDDAAELVGVVKEQLEAIGLIIGRLTGTDDTVERHVSLALRIPYTEDLYIEVEKINKEIDNFSFSTAAKLKIVTPPDIRTSESAVELLADNANDILQKWQILLYGAAQQTGNKLPPLHIHMVTVRSSLLQLKKL